MAPGIDRWKHIVLDPCNASAARRNIAAIRDSLQGLAEQEPATLPASPGGDSLIFFEVQADAVGGPSVSVRELVYNQGNSAWETTGGLYVAYDWTPSSRFKQNFLTGYFGIGRINTSVAMDALEIVALEGKARIVEVTLTENMGATTTKQASCDVDLFWGDAPNGRDPGSSLTIYDVTNMAPALTSGNKAIAIWDEKRQQYIMVAPWKGVQPPGQAAIVKVVGGDAGLGCDSSVEESHTFCLYQGFVQNVSLSGDLCNEDFTDGASIWILDARACHSNSRLGMEERYVAVSLGVTYDPDPNGPQSDERTIYGIVDYSPSFRWFRVLKDVETLVFGVPEVNDMKCRKHDCAGDQPDDAPSVWGVWEDINPCTRILGVLDNTPTLVFFPRFRSLCDPDEVDDEQAICLSKDSDPDCRKNEHILAYWNPIAERWDAVTDAEKCVAQQDIAKVVVCEADIIPECCLFDGLKVKFWPRNQSYCDPVREHEKIWIKCTNNATQLARGYCEIGVRICDLLRCDGEERPVYMAQCGVCPNCECPTGELNTMRWTIKIPNPLGPCGFLDGMTGTMFCLDENPFVVNPGNLWGWYGIMTIIGLTPRFLYFVEHPQIPNGVWLEISCGGEGVPPGTILAAWNDDDLPVAIPNPPFDSGILACRHKSVINQQTGVEVQLHRIRTYNYGIWATCSPQTGTISNVELYWLADSFTTTLIDPDCSDDGPKVVISNVNDVWSDAEPNIPTNTECCDNTKLLCFGKVFGCNAPDFELPWLAGVQAGTTSCNPCNHAQGHVFAGCPCNWTVQDANDNCVVGTLPCNIGPFPSVAEHLCCDHPDNQLCIELEWPQPFGLA